jgi:hypothetical protein
MHVLFRGIEDILVIFNGAPASPVQAIRNLVDDANRKAEPIWKNNDLDFKSRLGECRAILDLAFTEDQRSKPGQHRPVPSAVAEILDRIFRKHYSSSDFLLIGRADEDSYRIQDAYAREVGRSIGLINSSYESRAITCLGKAYGKTSIPLLCMSSVSALWQVCQSSFYKKQLSLVSQPTHTSTNFLTRDQAS